MTMHSVPDRETDQRARARHHGRLIAGATKIRSPAWNRVLGSDPGLLRLRSALQAVTTIGVAMVAGWLFVDLTHAMSVGSHGAVLSPQEQAIVASRDHAVTLVAVMLGAMVGMIASFFGALFPTPRSTVVNFALIPVPMVPGLALGLALGDHRVLALGSRAVVRDVGAYCRRFGPSGLLGGGLLFMGTFIGFFLHEQAGIEDIGWLTAEVAIGAAVAVVAQFTVFYPSRRAALRRMLRSFGVRSHEVSARALRLFTCPANRRAHVARSLRRRIVRLNETALLIDAPLGHESAVPAQWSAGELHHRLFDVELTLSTLARLTERITELDLPADLRAQVRGALAAVSDLDVARVEASGRELLRLLRATPTAADGAEQGLDRGAHIVLHRFATSVLGFAEAAQGSRRSAATVEDGSVRGPFTPSVTAFGGWLPGSAIVSATASLDTTGPRPSDRVRLQPHIRATIQMGVAIVAAIVLGNLLSGRHFYWAVIAAFVTFMGANNAGEQLARAPCGSSVRWSASSSAPSVHTSWADEPPSRSR